VAESRSGSAWTAGPFGVTWTTCSTSTCCRVGARRCGGYRLPRVPHAPLMLTDDEALAVLLGLVVDRLPG
jgi:hypothetical protein